MPEPKFDFKWRLHYEDGSTFSNLDGEPWESPVLGVCLVVQPDHDTDLLASRDYVLFRSDAGVWIETDIAGLFDQLETFSRHITAFRRTRLFPQKDEFRRLYRQVAIEIRGK